MMTPEQRKARRIGGSMIAKILKKSKWGTPLDAYLELTGERPSEDKTGEDIDRGNFLEPALRNWAAKKTGEKFMTVEQMKLPDWDWATVNPDGLSLNDAGVTSLLEIKAPRRDDALLWGEEGTDEIPTDPLLQTHWGLMVTNADRGIVASLLGGELRIYRVARDLAIEAKMLDAAKRFVDNHVLPGIPPPAEYGDDANVLYLHPRNTAPHRSWEDLTPEERHVVGEYLESYRVARFAEKQLGGWEPVAKNIVGDASGITLPAHLGNRLDWKLNASAATRWKALAESLMSKLPADQVEALKLEFAGTPSRVFRPWGLKEA